MNKLVYIVEDDINIRELESYALINSGYEVRGFENAAQLYSALTDKIPSLIILDIMLPGEDGLSVLNTVRNTPLYKRIPVIIVTAKTREIDAVKGLDTGADDYIAKPFGVMEFISRVRALLRRASTEFTDNTTFRNIFINEAKHKVFVNETEIDLTYKEYEILKLLILNENIVLTRDKLMESIWGYDFEQGNRTVDVHIQSLRKKLGDAGDYIKTIRNVGYKLGD